MQVKRIANKITKLLDLGFTLAQCKVYVVHSHDFTSIFMEFPLGVNGIQWGLMGCHGM